MIDPFAEVPSEYAKLRAAQEELRTVQMERDRLLAAITKHHSQKADDRCILDDDELYEAAGLPPVDRHIGDPDKMLENCKRFITQRCLPGKWKSYIDLEREYRRMAGVVRLLLNSRSVSGFRHSAKALQLLLQLVPDGPLPYDQLVPKESLMRRDVNHAETA